MDHANSDLTMSAHIALDKLARIASYTSPAIIGAVVLARTENSRMVACTPQVGNPNTACAPNVGSA